MTSTISSLNLPSVGRIVHYFTTNKFRHLNGVNEGPYAAMVTQVFPNGVVNLKIFCPLQAAYDESSVHEQDTAGKQDKYWMWPPRTE